MFRALRELFRACRPESFPQRGAAAGTVFLGCPVLSQLLDGLVLAARVVGTLIGPLVSVPLLPTALAFAVVLWPLSLPFGVLALIPSDVLLGSSKVASRTGDSRVQVLEKRANLLLRVPGRWTWPAWERMLCIRQS